MKAKEVSKVTHGANGRAGMKPESRLRDLLSQKESFEQSTANFPGLPWLGDEKKHKKGGKGEKASVNSVS